jgi:hypothetical protein
MGVQDVIALGLILIVIPWILMGIFTMVCDHVSEATWNN